VSKEIITAALVYPQMNKYEVKVFRQLDRFHVASSRSYEAKFTEPEKVRRLVKRFVSLVNKIQIRTVNERIESWK
jgi:hypothetical protein